LIENNTNNYVSKTKENQDKEIQPFQGPSEQDNYGFNTSDLDDYVDLNSDIEKFTNNYQESNFDTTIVDKSIPKQKGLFKGNDSIVGKGSNISLSDFDKNTASGNLVSYGIPKEFSGIEESSELQDFDIYDLYQIYDLEFFENLLGPIKLEWSKRMTQCAGIFSVRGNNISIRLSEPLLKFRSIKEIKETLLHEMTHAYLFMKGIESGRDGHGPKFLEKIEQINRKTGLHLTVYHTFHDEVDYYKTHIWRCNGKCQNEKPYYGYVKRSMNRPPGESDFWWQKHKSACGGMFIKISEPENYKKKNKENAEKEHKKDKKEKKEKKKSKKLDPNGNQLKLKDFFKNDNIIDN
jgi:predicted SprT family Zn-dependent metalloprotease